MTQGDGTGDNADEDGTGNGIDAGADGGGRPDAGAGKGGSDAVQQVLCLVEPVIAAAASPLPWRHPSPWSREPSAPWDRRGGR